LTLAKYSDKEDDNREDNSSLIFHHDQEVELESPSYCSPQYSDNDDDDNNDNDNDDDDDDDDDDNDNDNDKTTT